MKKGFTLIDLLAIVAIVGILTAIIAVTVKEATKQDSSVNEKYYSINDKETCTQ